MTYDRHPKRSAAWELVMMMGGKRPCPDVSVVEIGKVLTDTFPGQITIPNVNVPAGARIIVMLAHTADGIASNFVIDIDGTSLTQDWDVNRHEFWSTVVSSAVVNGTLRCIPFDVEPTAYSMIAVYAKGTQLRGNRGVQAGAGTNPFCGCAGSAKKKTLALASIMDVGRDTDALGTWASGYTALDRISTTTITLDQKTGFKITTAGSAPSSSLTGQTSRTWEMAVVEYEGFC